MIPTRNLINISSSSRRYSTFYPHRQQQQNSRFPPRGAVLSTGNSSDTEDEGYLN